METATTNLELTTDNGLSCHWIAAQIEYDYEPAIPGDRIDPPHPASISIQRIRFALGTDGPLAEWQENALLARALDTDDITEWLLEQHEQSDDDGSWREAAE